MKSFNKYCLSSFVVFPVKVKIFYRTNQILSQGQSPTLKATELREKLLREKVLALRRGSIGTRDQGTEET